MLTVLGGGGWLPAHGRHTATALIRQADAAVAVVAAEDRLSLPELAA